MLTRIVIRNSFAHAHREIDFETGMTAIVGPNGSGKSEIMDMIRFALFGTEALRTTTEDYNKYLSVELSFIVRDAAYVVQRTLKSAKLMKGADTLAVGIRPVNLKIVELLGYGMMVFDTANAARQGQIETMNTLRPAERKRMVDSVIGLDQIDDLTRWCGEEITSRTSTIRVLQSVLTPPSAPTRPEGYAPLSELQPLADQLTREEDELRRAIAFLAAEPARSPAPHCAEERTLDDLNTAQGKRIQTQSQLLTLQRQLAAMPAPPPGITEEILSATEVQWENIKQWDAATAYFKANPDPTFTEEQIARDEANLRYNQGLAAWKQLRLAGTHTCPKCAHTWAVRQEDMAKLGDYKEDDLPRSVSCGTVDGINRQRALIAHREANAAERTRLAALLAAHPARPNQPALAPAVIAQHRATLAAAASRAELQTHHTALTAALAGLPDLSGAIAVRRRYEAALADYEASERRWQDWSSRVPAMQERTAALADVPERRAAVLQLLTEVSIYEKLFLAYEKAQKEYQAALGKVLQLNAEVDQYQRAKLALTTMKGRVKSYLVPALSQVASMLAWQMSNGMLSQVAITEEFDITVDGKKLDGLSGAQKSIANLAIRIGLGQVLTHSVFSVFMADEVDAQMDDERAAATALALRKLSSSISQIVLVSHQKPMADHFVQLT